MAGEVAAIGDSSRCACECVHRCIMRAPDADLVHHVRAEGVLALRAIQGEDSDAWGTDSMVVGERAARYWHGIQQQSPLLSPSRCVTLNSGVRAQKVRAPKRASGRAAADSADISLRVEGGCEGFLIGGLPTNNQPKSGLVVWSRGGWWRFTSQNQDISGSQVLVNLFPSLEGPSVAQPALVVHRGALCHHPVRLHGNSRLAVHVTRGA